MTAVRPERPLYAADSADRALQEAFVEGAFPVAVYGLGKMGLPLAAVFADLTGNVTGVDIDPDVVSAVQRGESPVEGEPGLAELVAETTADGSLRATSDPAGAAADARLHVVIVPTLLDETKDPDLSALLAAVDAIAEGLSHGDLVVVESTVPPGTTRDVVAPRLAERSGLDPGEFGVAFCPERTASGRALEDIRGAYPKVVGGVDAESERVASLLYDEVTSNEVVRAGDATTAECVKVFEGIYRDVNIALANELARVVDPLDVDVSRAIEVANTQPFCDIHDPGPGVGGHCIPLYPHFLTSQVETDLPLIETSRSVNDAMPAFVTSSVVQLLGDRGLDVADADVLLLGVAYRAGVDETRKAPASQIARYLSKLGASVYATDPVVDVGDVQDLTATPLAHDDIESTAPRFDAVVLVTAHEAYDTIAYDAFENGIVVDTRDVVENASIPVYTIGRGRS
ncbi:MULTISPECIES: nucleotide sugar dehydrogenase [Haloarcula]|uniref:UDP-N-acetyl-D-mannosamine dehydrogenase n=1 Tax=Haloarcula pellucida TaxID=1427151 RepID=A0A830GJH4_9EURY|nr:MULTISPECIES: nucleotide sugar dehydrogenase [Halomicroarcula]MBX0347372.1 nucleotide sugar dehydrogenase [Halomicroarcula pellucida]MDS0276754.1 nucleotide sugar dehydrogenase [Halomicroarcula sp. S1AR25-4]GGN88342.1 NDP-sugar dehydrogenase [Halomicroarcula pellucida]